MRKKDVPTGGDMKKKGKMFPGDVETRGRGPVRIRHEKGKKSELQKSSKKKPKNSKTNTKTTRNNKITKKTRGKKGEFKKKKKKKTEKKTDTGEASWKKVAKIKPPKKGWTKSIAGFFQRL